MNDLVDRLARQVDLTANVVWVLVALALALSVGSAVRLGWLLRPAVAPEVRGSRLGSLATWWVLFVLLVHSRGAVLAPSLGGMVTSPRTTATASATVSPAESWMVRSPLLIA